MTAAADGPGPARQAALAPPVHTSRRWRHHLRHSLQARLVLLFLLLALGISGLFFAATRELFSTGWRDLARPLLADYLDRLAAEIGSPPDVARARAITTRLPLSIRIDGPQVQWASHPQRHGHGPRNPAVHDGAGDGPHERLSDGLVRHTADGHQIRFGLGDWRWAERPRWHGWLGLAGLLALTAGAYAVVRRLFRPLDDIRAGALRYGQGDFSQTIPLRRRDELGELAAQVNNMVSGLQHMLDGQRGLLLAISHELRSPLTRARLHAELLADGPERNALLRDLGLMRDLVSDLLEAERLAVGAAALQRAPTDLNLLVQDLVAAQFADSGVLLQLGQALPVLWLDRARLQLLVRNLLDNALRHGAGTAVLLRTQRDAAGVIRLTVRDHGPGVDPSQLPRLSDAFYRPDAARTRASGGVGLGLSLCQRVASSHGGSLELCNAQPGLAVSLVLPATRASPPTCASPPTRASPP